MIHVFLYLFSTLFSTVSDLSKISSRYIKFSSYIIASSFLLIPLALRGKYVGIDTPEYYRMYYWISSVNNPLKNTDIEPGYILLTNLSSMFSDTPPLLISITAIISFCGVMFFIFKYSPNYTLSIALMSGIGIYGFMYNGIRQAIAHSLILMSLHYLMSNQVWKYLLLIVIASTFHYTALVFLLALLFFKFKPNLTASILIWLISLIFLLPNISYGFLSNIAGYIPENYSSYASGKMESYATPLKMVTNQAFCLFYIFSIWLHKKINFNNSVLLMIYLSFFGFILGNILFHLGWISRLAYYFQIVALVSLPIIISKAFTRQSRITLYFVGYCIFTIIYLRGLSLGSNAMVPYTFVLF